MRRRALLGRAGDPLEITLEIALKSLRQGSLVCVLDIRTYSLDACSWADCNGCDLIQTAECRLTIDEGEIGMI